MIDAANSAQASLPDILQPERFRGSHGGHDRRLAHPPLARAYPQKNRSLSFGEAPMKVFRLQDVRRSGDAWHDRRATTAFAGSPYPIADLPRAVDRGALGGDRSISVTVALKLHDPEGA
jgi:hypothetical protein